MILEKFLDLKPLYYDKIDYNRFPKIYKKISINFKLPKIVHVVGTNAKGSTGRALSHMLFKLGKRVGHYSSPHILKFNERIWLDGSDVRDELLEEAHQELQNILDSKDSDSLSYFEYTTLLAMLIFCKNCDFVVLEAGLGGEFDATNVFPKDLSIITPIGYDHESFLGDNIESIANTKLRSVTKNLLLAKQYENEVYELAIKRVEEIEGNLFFANSYLCEEFYNALDQFISKNNYPTFFKDNFSTAFCALEFLGFEFDIELLEDLKLFGRCQKIESNITIDVGHNPMAASAISSHFSEKKVTLVYNSLNDKEYRKILLILKPIIDKVLIIDIDSEREVLKQNLEDTLDSLHISYDKFKKIEENEEYLVFGSFSVIEAFLIEKYKR